MKGSLQDMWLVCPAQWTCRVSGCLAWRMGSALRITWDDPECFFQNRHYLGYSAVRTSLQHLVLTKAKHWITKQSSKDAVKRLVQKRVEVMSLKPDRETCNINRYILCFVAVPAGEEQWNSIFHQETAVSFQVFSNLLPSNYPAIWSCSFW